MSDTVKTPATGFIDVIKMPTLEPILKAQKCEPVRKDREGAPIEGETFSGIAYPPLALSEILTLAYSNAFHTQCIALKSEMAVGMEYEAPKQVEDYLESLAVQQDSFLDLLNMVAWDWECLGNGYLEIARDRKGRIAELYHMHGQTVFSSTEGNKLKEYQQWIDTTIPFSVFGDRDGRNELMHFKRYTPFSSWYGLPEWVACLEALRLDQEKKTFYAAFFKNFAVPSLAVVLEGAEFDVETERKLQEGFAMMKGNDNAFRTLLLSIPMSDAKVKFERLMADFKDMPFDKLSQVTREEILAAHGVPPRLVGIVTAGALGGGDEAATQLNNFLRTKIQPRTKYLERRVKRILRDAGLPEEFVLKGTEPEATEATPDAWENSRTIAEVAQIAKMMDLI